MDILVNFIQGGLGSLAAYLAAHVLLCLVPAFFIAGAMTALIPKDIITRFLGRTTPKYLSYPAAALAGSVLAVCSCTIVPIFAGIYKKGAGLGPAITFLFFAPAANILALVYTGGIIGVDLAFARLFLSLAFGIGIGMIMALIFRREDQSHDEATDSMFGGKSKIHRAALILLLMLVALLISGTLKIELLTRTYAQMTIPVSWAQSLQSVLDHLVPFDANKGEEGITVQGLILIFLLASIGITAWKGLENIIEKFSFWTYAALGLTILTLITASLGMNSHSGGFAIQLKGKSFGVIVSLGIIFYLVRFCLNEEEVREWLSETWGFVKKIFPLLIIGVFCVGIIRQIIKPEWIESLAGRNSLLGNFAGVVFGVFMYFPTLVEVPIAKMFLNLGMHRGPLLAYLMADPELSLQSILIISAIIGRFKTWIYVGWVALFSILAGLIYGAWADGASIAKIISYMILIIAVLAFALYWVDCRIRNSASPLIEIKK
ncbi:MAG: permease [Phycisphaerales bacterium]